MQRASPEKRSAKRGKSNPLLSISVGGFRLDPSPVRFDPVDLSSPALGNQIAEEMFIAQHNLEPVLAHARVVAESVFDTRLLGMRQHMQADPETGELYLRVEVDVDVSDSDYIPTQDAFLDQVWSEFETVDAQTILFFVQRAPAHTNG